MIRPLCVLTAAALVTACTNPFATRQTSAPPTPEDSQLVFGSKYSKGSDQCRRVGTSELTEGHVNDRSDLVACPIEDPARGRFAIDSNSTELARTENWVVYSVPIP